MSENNIIKVMIKSVLWPIMLSVLSDRVASISGLGKLCGNMGEVNQGGALHREGLRHQTGCPELVTLWNVPFHVGRQRGQKLSIVEIRAGYNAFQCPSMPCNAPSGGWGMLGIQKHHSKKRGMWVTAWKTYKTKERIYVLGSLCYLLIH